MVKVNTYFSNEYMFCGTRYNPYYEEEHARSEMSV